MGVLEHVIELIKAACDKDFAEVNWIGKGGRVHVRVDISWEPPSCFLRVFRLNPTP